MWLLKTLAGNGLSSSNILKVIHLEKDGRKSQYVSEGVHSINRAPITYNVIEYFTRLLVTHKSKNLS